MGPREGSGQAPCWQQDQLRDQPRSVPAFSSLALNRGEICTAASGWPAPLPAWPPPENLFPCVQPEPLFLPPLPSLILQRKDKTYRLFHRLLTVVGKIRPVVRWPKPPSPGIWKTKRNSGFERAHGFSRKGSSQFPFGVNGWRKNAFSPC